MTLSIHLRKVNEKQYRLFKSSAARKSISLSRAFEEAISIWASSMDETSEDHVLNDIIYKRMKKKLQKMFPNKFAVIADGKFVGAEETLEKAWVLASPYENALVTKIAKKPLRARMLGSSLRLIASETL